MVLFAVGHLWRMEAISACILKSGSLLSRLRFRLVNQERM
jgi:hypothetical protein